MRFTVLFLTCLAVTFAAAHNAAFAYQGTQQQAATTMQNSDVVRMVGAGLDAAVIVTAIEQAAAVQFQLSPDDLIALRNAGVPDRVIQTMQKVAATASGSSSTSVIPDGEPCRVFITEEDPPSRSYVVVKKEVQVGKKFYGGHDEQLMTRLATEADKAGADAIIRFHEWRAPSMWSWAAAKAGGMAVRWTSEGRSLVPTLKGQCWVPQADKK